MTRIFVDTSAWAAIEDRRDSNHEVALLFKDEISGRCMLVTTDYVLDEAYTLLSRWVSLGDPDRVWAWRPEPGGGGELATSRSPVRLEAMSIGSPTKEGFLEVARGFIPA